MTETPSYTVIEKQGDIELRNYPAYIKAEVEVVGTPYRKAIFKGFSMLANYIFGDNVKTEKIAMASPVQVSQSEKIAMTKPVTISGEGTYTVAFIMPSEYTMESLPKPKDPAISFTKVESQTMAAISFSGFYREQQVKKSKRQLETWLKKEGIQAAGEFVVAGYDPPWVPWFLARNEVMIPIKPKGLRDL